MKKSWWMVVIDFDGAVGMAKMNLTTDEAANLLARTDVYGVRSLPLKAKDIENEMSYEELMAQPEED